MKNESKLKKKTSHYENDDKILDFYHENFLSRQSH